MRYAGVIHIVTLITSVAKEYHPDAIHFLMRFVVAKNKPRVFFRTIGACKSFPPGQVLFGKFLVVSCQNVDFFSLDYALQAKSKCAQFDTLLY